MPKICRLQPVCLEPLLFAFGAPRTIRSALAEYAQHLRSEAATAQGEDTEDAAEIIAALERFLDPIDAPLASLTAPLVQTLVRSESLVVPMLRPSPIVRRAERFFAWAAGRGYVKQNPFESLSHAGPGLRRPLAPAA